MGVLPSLAVTVPKTKPTNVVFDALFHQHCSTISTATINPFLAQTFANQFLCSGWQSWIPPPSDQGGCYEVVPDQVRRCHPLKQSQVVGCLAPRSRYLLLMLC